MVFSIIPHVTGLHDPVRMNVGSLWASGKFCGTSTSFRLLLFDGQQKIYFFGVILIISGFFNLIRGNTADIFHYIAWKFVGHFSFHFTEKHFYLMEDGSVSGCLLGERIQSMTRSLRGALSEWAGISTTTFKVSYYLVNFTQTSGVGSNMSERKKLAPFTVLCGLTRRTPVILSLCLSWNEKICAYVCPPRRMTLFLFQFS